MIGDTGVEQVFLSEEEDGYTGMGLEQFYRPRSLFPAPRLFWTPTTIPLPIRTQLELGFQLFWTDLSASLSRFRTAIELMLDDKGAPKSAINTKGISVRLNLAQRIDKFAQTSADDTLKDQLQALRHIGNLGTHGSSVGTDDYFDAVDVLEDAILGVYEKKSLKSKVAKLSALK